MRRGVTIGLIAILLTLIMTITIFPAANAASEELQRWSSSGRAELNWESANSSTEDTDRRSLFELVSMVEGDTVHWDWSSDGDLFFDIVVFGFEDSILSDDEDRDTSSTDGKGKLSTSQPVDYFLSWTIDNSQGNYPIYVNLTYDVSITYTPDNTVYLVIAGAVGFIVLIVASIISIIVYRKIRKNRDTKEEEEKIPIERTGELKPDPDILLMDPMHAGGIGETTKLPGQCLITSIFAIGFSFLYLLSLGACMTILDENMETYGLYAQVVGLVAVMISVTGIIYSGISISKTSKIGDMAGMKRSRLALFLSIGALGGAILLFIATVVFVVGIMLSWG